MPGDKLPLERRKAPIVLQVVVLGHARGVDLEVARESIANGAKCAVFVHGLSPRQVLSSCHAAITHVVAVTCPQKYTATKNTRQWRGCSVLACLEVGASRAARCSLRVRADGELRVATHACSA